MSQCLSASAPQQLPPNPEQSGPDESQMTRDRIYRRERRERPDRTNYGSDWGDVAGFSTEGTEVGLNGYVRR